MRRLVFMGIVVARRLRRRATRARAPPTTSPRDRGSSRWTPATSRRSRSTARRSRARNEVSTIYGAPTSCPDGAIAGKDGVLKAYGLIYRLLQNNVPVYYILDTTKTASTASTSPSRARPPRRSRSSRTRARRRLRHHHRVHERGATSRSSIAARRSSSRAADVPTALALLKTDTDFTGTDSRTGRTYFQDVQIHQAKVNILQAPVRAILLQTPPKIALMDIGGAAIGVLQGYLKDAGLYTATATAPYPTIGDVFTQFNNVTDFTTSNGLTAGGFSILWAPHWEGNYSITTTQRDAVIAEDPRLHRRRPSVRRAVRRHRDDGRRQLAAVVRRRAGAPSLRSPHHQRHRHQRRPGDATAQPAELPDRQRCHPGQPVDDGAGLHRSADADRRLPARHQHVELDLRLHARQRLLVQVVHQLVRAVEDRHKLPDRDRRPQRRRRQQGPRHLPRRPQLRQRRARAARGSLHDVRTRCNDVGLERLILNSLIFLGQVPRRASRRARRRSSSTTRPPAVRCSARPTSARTCSRPRRRRPIRRGPATSASTPAGALSGTNVTSFNVVTSDWDAVRPRQDPGARPTRAPSTRSVPQSGKLTQIAVHHRQPQQGPDGRSSSATTSLITQIRQGVLGGIDHSIPAIIGPSESWPARATRPTVAYFGALDGMIHAILVIGHRHRQEPGRRAVGVHPPTASCSRPSRRPAASTARRRWVTRSSTPPAPARAPRGTRCSPSPTAATPAARSTSSTSPTRRRRQYLWTASDTVTVERQDLRARPRAGRRHLADHDDGRA